MGQSSQRSGNINHGQLCITTTTLPRKNTDVNSAADRASTILRSAVDDTHLSAYLHQARAEATVGIHDEWRFGKHLLHPAFRFTQAPRRHKSHRRPAFAETTLNVGQEGGKSQ